MIGNNGLRVAAAPGGMIIINSSKNTKMKLKKKF